MSAEDDVAALRRRLDAALAEIDGLRLTLDVVGTMDLDTAILNRNGILEALERARRWQTRRGDVYGVLIACSRAPLPASDTWRWFAAWPRRSAPGCGRWMRWAGSTGDRSPPCSAIFSPGAIDVVARRGIGPPRHPRLRGAEIGGTVLAWVPSRS